MKRLPVGKRESLAKVSIGAVVFTVLALVSGVAIYSVVTNAAIRDESTYNALFEDVSGLREGADVQVAGAVQGQVSNLELQQDGRVKVEFTLASDVPISTTSTAVVRYKDLLGRRILQIRPGSQPGSRLALGATIPTKQTTPALDLDQLYNGFAPLFQGLDSNELNQLSASLITVMQGQGDDFESILQRTASLTDSIGDRDKVIASLISNLGTVLDTVEQRTPQTDALVVQLQRLVGGLAKDRAALGQAMEGIGGSTGAISQLLADIRPSVRGDLAEVRRLSRILNADQAELERYLQRAPGYHALLGRVGIYQSAFQFYLCGAQVRLQVPGGKTVTTKMTRSQEKRCQS